MGATEFPVVVDPAGAVRPPAARPKSPELVRSAATQGRKRVARGTAKGNAAMMLIDPADDNLTPPAAAAAMLGHLLLIVAQQANRDELALMARMTGIAAASLNREAVKPPPPWQQGPARAQPAQRD